MNSELIYYYVNLLIIQYHDKPNARALIYAIIRSLVIYDIMIQVREGFNIETAIGTQLDMLAKYIGVERVVTGVVFDRLYFGFADYTETTPFVFGRYADYTTINIDEQFRNYAEERKSLYILIDPELRLLIKMKIIQNNGNGSNKEIDDLMIDFFNNEILFFERYPMLETFIFQKNKQRLAVIARYENVLPRPAGVGLTFSFVNDINHIFAYKKYGQTAPVYAVGYKLYGEDKAGGWTFYGET